MAQEQENAKTAEAGAVLAEPSAATEGEALAEGARDLLTGLAGNGSLMVSGSATIAEIELAATRAIESLGGTP